MNKSIKLVVQQVRALFCIASLAMVNGCSPLPPLPSADQSADQSIKSQPSQSVPSQSQPVDVGSTIIRSVEALQPNSVCNHRFSSVQANSKPVFVETEKNTIITGSNRRELVQSLVSTVPNRGVGNTRWDLNWSFESQLGRSGCSVSRAEAEVIVNYQLPLWPDQLYAIDRNLRDQWNLYSDSLRDHHCKHGKTGIEASIEVKESLVRMAPRKSCALLEADADELARSIIGGYKDFESKFIAPDVANFIN